MPDRRTGVVFLLLLGAACIPHTDAVAWRLFAGREECITEYLPDFQWAMTKQKDPSASSTRVLIDIGVLVSSRYGGESNKASVDMTVYDPRGEQIYQEEGMTETEAAVNGDGGQGPWRVCFKVSRGQILRPSVIVKVSYFTVNQVNLVGTNFEWQQDEGTAGSAGAVDPSELGSAQQVADMSSGLQRLDTLLMNVTYEQRYLYARTVRHLRTVESTHARALWYQLLIYFFIILTSFAQAVGVRLMFKGSRRQGLII